MAEKENVYLSILRYHHNPLALIHFISVPFRRQTELGKYFREFHAQISIAAIV